MELQNEWYSSVLLCLSRLQTHVCPLTQMQFTAQKLHGSPLNFALVSLHTFLKMSNQSPWSKLYLHTRHKWHILMHNPPHTLTYTHPLTPVQIVPPPSWITQRWRQKRTQNSSCLHLDTHTHTHLIPLTLCHCVIHTLVSFLSSSIQPFLP